MIYRDTMPSGQAHGQSYDGQRPTQNPPQQPQPYPQYTNANGFNCYPVNGHAPFQQDASSQPAYPQQPASYYTNSASHLNNYNSAFNRPSPVDAAPPLQFVNPSFLQNHVAPKPVPPAPEPVTTPASTASPQIPPVSRLPQQAASVKSSPKNSPKLGDKRTLLQGISTKPAKRPASGTGIAGSPVLSQSPAHVETLPLLLCVAEDCFEKANSAVQDVARFMSAEETKEHHQLMATGLGCLEIAMKSNKLSPRLEARLCLRYASILTEETTNLMEAETALTRGIAVCEKHRFTDLKYSSQFLLMKTLFQRNQKAAFKSVDTHIADCTTFKHVHWVYAFRFLKAAFHLQSGGAADHHALENLRRIADIANQREDKAIYVMATLLEGLAHLGSMKEDCITRVQTCIAQASKWQFDASVHLPQIDVLLLLLDLVCSLREKDYKVSVQKMDSLLTRLDELKDTADLFHEILLPIRRVPNLPQTISTDTQAILRPGDSSFDYLVLSTLGKQELFALANVFDGIVSLHRDKMPPARSFALWDEAVRLLEGKTRLSVDPVTRQKGPLDRGHVSTSQSLAEALKQSEWAKELVCYVQVLVGLQAATLSDWARVKHCVDTIRELCPSTGFLDTMTLYLEGVLMQGTTRLNEALEIWRDERFEMDWSGATKTHSASQIEMELAILAALNRLWIRQAGEHRDNADITEIVDLLRPLCEDNPDREIRTAYNLVMASIDMEPPLSINQVKSCIQSSVAGAQRVGNTQFLSMALNLMRWKLFENVVGEQALKCAMAAVAQAKKTGNLLWMSVADGMLAQSRETQGELERAQADRESAVRLANEAYARTRV
ncbi:cohesin loading factor-domain-containing protein [Apodospora peruviana]|uniref:Cohesin loading factor-domain-containing protein n=1 Tax=Apodospora peruviana TaxID=516989 RepID=A0AAE0IIT2_9PEZI|nr:cohesin loading factor-domain-containing protein [Apodospora peruviana]